MTEASNLPEREPDNSQGGEAARVTHIRSGSGRFSPRSPEGYSGTLTPASGRVEPLIAPPILPEAEIVPQYLPQEPDLTHKEGKGIPLKAKLAGAAATLAVAAAGAFGYNKINSSAEDEANVIIVPAPTQVIPTPENPQPTVEATKTPEKSPYNFTIQKSVGEVTLSLEDKLLVRTECPDPAASSKSANFIPCDPIHDVMINKDNFPNVEQDVQEAGIKGFYYAWKNQDPARENITYGDYKAKLEKGEDLSFKTRGFQGNSFLPTDIVVKPTDSIHIDWIAEPISIFKPFTSFGVGYRKINDEFHVELFNYLPPNGEQKQITRNYPISNYLGAIAYLSNYKALQRGTMLPSEADSFSNISADIGAQLFTKTTNGTYIVALNLE